MLGRIHVFIQTLAAFLKIDNGLIQIFRYGRILDQPAKCSLSTVNFGHNISQLIRNNLGIARGHL